MRKPSIAYLIYNTKHCGGNKVVFEHVNRLTKRGYNVSLYTIFGNQPDWFPLVIKIKRISAYYFNPKPDILTCTFWPTSYISVFLKSKTKFYFIQAVELNFYQNFLLKWLVIQTYYLPFKQIVVSKYIANNLKKYAKNKPKIISNSIDKSIFKPKTNTNNKKKRISILSVVTDYSYYKGVDMLTSAIKEIKKKSNNYKFTLATTETEPYDKIFDVFISNPDQNKLVTLYQDADIFLNTSRSEGFPLPPIEAMACGCILIATNSGGILEYAKNNKNAIIVNDIKNLWKKDLIKKILSNKKLVEKLKKNGLNTAQHYDWNKIIDYLEMIYLNKLH